MRIPFSNFAILVMGAVIAAGAEPARTPVLVELFTSEGCSDCPPADALLEKLDQLQPVAGAGIIVLSEHVDYWNHLGWSDPYSSPMFSRRQEDYGERFHLTGPYTPQMVVDGVTEFVGSDARRALSAIGSAAKAGKVNLRLSRAGANVHVEIDVAPHGGNVYLVWADSGATSQVLRGENRGRKLHHVAVVRRMEQIGKWNGRTPFTKDVTVGEAAKDGRLVAFVQDPGSGRIRGAAMDSRP